MSILVTGGAGYIGTHTCVELLNAGYEIVVVDNFSNSKPEALNRVREITGRDFVFYELDLLNRDGLEKIFIENEIEAVIHLAGIKEFGDSVEVPLWYYHNNLFSTVILCEVMKKFNVKKLVFSSSATVYGVPESVPIHEESTVRAANPYGRTKQMIEEILHDLYVSDHEWNVALLRYFNPIGAHKSGRMGEETSDIPTNLLSSISQVVAGRLETLTVFDHDDPTPDGTGIRDYIHVVDLAIGHVRALEKILNSDRGIEAYNLGTGKGYSVLEIVSAFEKVSGRTIPYQMKKSCSEHIGVCYVDPTKSRNELGWVAERGLLEMCEDSWRWHDHNPDGYVEKIEEKVGKRGIIHELNR